MAFDHVFADVGVTGLAEEDEADLAVFEFLVHAGDAHELIGVEVVRESHGQIEALQQGDDLVMILGGEVGNLGGEPCGGAKTEADGLTVQQLAIAGGGFDGVAKGVAEVQQRPRADGFEFVGFDDGGFDRDVAPDEGDEIAFAVGDVFDRVEHGGVADGGVLDDFGETLIPLALRQRVKRIDISDDVHGLVEAAHHVFGGRQVHAGLSADGAVHLREHGRRDLDVGDAALVNRSAKATKVTDHATTEGDEEALAVKAGADHLAEHRLAP